MYSGKWLKMRVFYPILFVLLIVAPILLAWLKGDRILDRIAARRQQRRQRRRQRSIRALPIQEDTLQALIGAEERRDRTDSRIGEALAAFERLSEGWRASAAPLRSSTATIDEIEKVLLFRESRFSTYIDIAWFQSETIELMIQEVELLRELAGMSPDWPGDETASLPPAAERLIQNLNRASRKRAELDRRIDRVGTARPAAEPSSHFDVTVE